MKEITYETATKANTIARQIAEQTKMLKNDTRFGHEQNIECEVKEIEDLMTGLRELLFPLPF